MATTPNSPTENGRYFLVGPDKQVIVVHKQLFEVIEQFVKPNHKFGIVELTFKNGGLCGIRKIEHVL